MKKYLSLAVLLLAGNVYAAEEVAVKAPATQEEVVITEKDMQEAMVAAQEAVKALAEAMNVEVKEEAAEDSK
ncbi:MAG: hypothetical protein US49_C0007G0013 [candidate division TM6 bacterium GW2011_GWF2_37_49]|nr:MAG: hypothetical protein US49_C0007G0013 [candidate division TM6 bacterium GW2011_GWF2_37_49]